MPNKNTETNVNKREEVEIHVKEAELHVREAEIHVRSDNQIFFILNNYPCLLFDSK